MLEHFTPNEINFAWVTTKQKDSRAYPIIKHQGTLQKVPWCFISTK